MPDTIGGYWGTKQFARDLPLPVVRATSTGQTFADDCAFPPPPHETGDTILIIAVIRFDAAASFISIPPGLTLVCEFSEVATSASRVHVYRKEVTGAPDYTTYHFVKTGVSGSFINCSAHSILGAGPIENITHDNPEPPFIPAITTTRPNCLLVCAYSARYGAGQFFPTAADRVWEGLGASYIGAHWNAYERLALIPGTYGPTTVPDNFAQDQYVVMQVSPFPAPPVPDLTITALAPSTGVIAGGTTVTVTGTGFAVGATTVTIGTTTIPAGSVTVLSGTQLTFVTPAEASGVKTVQEVTVTVGGYTSNKLSYTYNAAGGYSPASLTSLQCWLDTSESSKVTLVSGKVSEWRDLSINRLSIISPVPSTDGPSYTEQIGGLNVMTWTDDRLASTTEMQGERPRTFCWIMQPAAPGTEMFVFSREPLTISISAAGNLQFGCGYGIDTGIPTAGLHVWTVEFNAYDSRAWKDGTLVWSGDPGSAVSPGSLGVGANGFGAARFNGYLPELMTYGRVGKYLDPQLLTDSQRNALVDYLTAKWMTINAPDPPTAVSGTAGNAEVALTWTAPAYNGGASITDYVVQWALSSAPTAWTTFSEGTSTATATTVTGLTNGTAYIFRVAAVNSVGTSAYSTASSAVTPIAPTAPGAPTLNTATPGDTTVALAWTAGSTGGTAITDYVIEMSPNSSTGWTAVTESVSTATNYTVTGLTNGTIQYFRVAAINTAGQGAYSNTLSATPAAAGGTTPAIRSFASSLTLTCNKPAGTVEGDLLIGWYWRSGGGGNVAQFGPPAGWTTADENSVGFGTEGGVYWKAAGASEPSSYTWTNTDTGGDHRVIIVALQGAHLTTPINAFSKIIATDTGSAGLGLVMPSITPSVDACLGLAFFALYAFSISGWTLPAGWTVDTSNSASGSAGSGHKNTALTTSASGTISAIPTGGGVNNAKGLGYLLAVRGA